MNETVAEVPEVYQVQKDTIDILIKKVTTLEILVEILRERVDKLDYRTMGHVRFGGR